MHRSGQYFQPVGIRWVKHMLRRFGQATAVMLPENYQACLHCGLVWNNLLADDLRRLMEREEIAIEAKDEYPEID